MSSESWIDRPHAVAELRAALDAYEAALQAADAAALDRFFWRDERAVRFGLAEELFGHDAIAAFNSRRSKVPDRRTREFHITTFGDDFGVTTLFFDELGNGSPGRQMQTWARIDGAWCVVAAHVSAVDRAGSSGTPS